MDAIIDTHTHIYPDKIAPKIEAVIIQQVGYLWNSFKVSSLLDTMAKCGIGMSIVFCIAERPEIVKRANDFVISVQREHGELIGFGTIHPDFEAYREEIKRLKESEIRGIKLSSTFQNFHVGEERMMRIYQALEEEGLILYLHAGREEGRAIEDARTTPNGIGKVLDTFPKLKVVAAHFGGLDMLEAARKHLLGRELYFDTSWFPSVEVLDRNEIAELIQQHGSSKVLFGSDYPTTEIEKQIRWISDLPLSAEDKELIFHKNAQRLLDIPTAT